VIRKSLDPATTGRSCAARLPSGGQVAALLLRFFLVLPSLFRLSLAPCIKAQGRKVGVARLRQRGSQSLALRQPCEKILADISLREENSPEPHDLAIMMALPAQEAKGQSNPQ